MLRSSRPCCTSAGLVAVPQGIEICVEPCKVRTFTFEEYEFHTQLGCLRFYLFAKEQRKDKKYVLPCASSCQMVII